MPEMRYIPITQLREPPHPLRISMADEKMRDLIDDIRVQGIVQSLAVFPEVEPAWGATRESQREAADTYLKAGGIFVIEAGHRRYKAACAIGLVEAPCMIFPDKKKAGHAIMLAENTLREDVTPYEEGVWFAELIEENDFTEEQLLDAVKRPAAYVYARLDLLKGSPDVAAAIRDRKIGLSVAQQLNRVDDLDHCRYLCNMAVEGGATARIVMEWVKEYKAHGPSPVVDLKPFVEAGKEGAAVAGPPACFLCGSNHYPANIVWVPIHDFERDALIANVQRAARVQVPQEGQDGNADNPA